MGRRLLLLGIDGGATGCRARLTDFEWRDLGAGSAGPANIRFGIEEGFASVFQATDRCLAQAGLAHGDAMIVACLALAGASEPGYLAAARAHKHPFDHVLITTDALAACVGAHAGRDGGVIVVGTGSVGWAVIRGCEHRVGGWGFPISDEGSGAWLGCEAIRRALWAYDGRMAWTDLLEALFAHFERDANAIVRWMSAARPRDFARLAPFVLEHASRNDAVACELMRQAAGYIDVIVRRLAALGADRLALAGGIAPAIEPWLAEATRTRLVAAEGDAVDGALRLARREAEAMASGPLGTEPR